MHLIFSYSSEPADGTGYLQRCSCRIGGPEVREFWDSEFRSCCAVCSLSKALKGRSVEAFSVAAAAVPLLEGNWSWNGAEATQPRVAFVSN